MAMKPGTCCIPAGEGEDSSCCGLKKELDIDFLYLDRETCARCRGTGETLEKALQDVAGVLKASGYKVNLRETNITTREMAEQFELRTSPTIRINGKDIAMTVRETACRDCGDLCGDSVDCRTWEHGGGLYDEPPLELIVDAILRAVYGGGDGFVSSPGPYVLPGNLSTYFDGLERKGIR